MSAKVLLLNGPSSSGKSTLAKLLQKELEAKTGESFGIVSIDDFLPMSMDTKIYEDDVFEISEILCNTASQMAKVKNVIIDHVITSQRIFYQLKELLGVCEWYMVHVTCPLDELLRREQHRKNRCIGTAEASFLYLYPKEGYDVVADTFHDSVEEIVKQVVEVLDQRNQNLQ